VSGPLDGVRVLDFGQYLAGPFGPMILADLGADVIKIEPVRGDGMRLAGKPYFGCQRGKRDIAIDLKTPDGLALALRLVATADVVHHNMTKGTAARLGLGYDACRAERADIIYGNTYAYGPEGPLSHFGGLDPLYQASGGLEHEAGAVHEGNEPLYYRFGMCDAGNAMLSVVGLLLALHHRDRTGEGQELWTSLLDAGALFSADAVLRADGTPLPRPRLDAGLHGFDPGYRLYECADDTWICIAAIETDAWRALGAVCELETGDDRALVEPELERRFRDRRADAWHALLDDAGVPNEISWDPDSGFGALSDPGNVGAGLVAEYEHATMGRTRQFGTLIHFSDSAASIDRPPPLVGEHTREILDELGVDEAERERLRAAEVVAWPGDDYAERYGAW